MKLQYALYGLFAALVGFVLWQVHLLKVERDELLVDNAKLIESVESYKVTLSFINNLRVIEVKISEDWRREYDQIDKEAENRTFATQERLQNNSDFKDWGKVLLPADLLPSSGLPGGKSGGLLGETPAAPHTTTSDYGPPSGANGRNTSPALAGKN